MLKTALIIGAMLHALNPFALTAAQTVPATSTFVTPGELTLDRVLPRWPADETLQGQADLDTVLAFQAFRSPAQEAEANADAPRGPVEWAQNILGSTFSAETYPLTTALIVDVHNDMRAINRAANNVHGLRPRPAIRDARVKPSLPNVAQADNPSYPSARTAGSLVWAYVLAEIFPEHRDAFFTAADRTAWLRLLGGAHYPSDIAGGRLVGEAAWQALRRNSAFHLRLAEAKAEVQTRNSRAKP